MKLSAYLAKNRLTASAFAERIGVSVSTVTRIINGQRRPDLNTAALIESATGRKVRPQDFYELEKQAG